MLRCNSLLNISSSLVWEACYSCRCQKKRHSLTFSLTFSRSRSLSLCAALIPRQVLQCACSVGSSCLIVCYYFNTYIMYFIKICCQSLSVPLHPITQGFFSLFIYFYLFIFVTIIFCLWFVFLLLPGIQLSWLLFYDVVMTPSDGFIISSPFCRVLIVASGLLFSEKFHRVCSVLLNARSPKISACFS